MYSDYIVFLDLEMTGLDVNNHRIIELGALITDWNLDFVAEFEQPIYTPLDNLLQMDSVVREMHTKNGLISEIPQAATLAEVERDFIQFLDEHHLVTQGNILIVGYSVHTDKEWIKRWMPDLHKLLHYRIIEVSTVRTLAQTWRPDIPPVGQVSAHRALPDCYEARQELKYIKDWIFNG